MTYYLADANGDDTLWRDNGEDDPTAVMARHETTDETWQLLLRGAGLDGETVRVSREDLEIVIESVAGEAGPPDFTDALRRLSLSIFAAGAEATR